MPASLEFTDCHGFSLLNRHHYRHQASPALRTPGGRASGRVLARLPNRLHAEALLQTGRALTHVRGRVDEGREKLHRAMKIAEEDGWRKVHAACHLALSESFAAAGQPADALTHWQDARQIMEDTESTFLAEWERRLGRTLGGAGYVLLDLKQRSHHLTAELEKTYFRFRTAGKPGKDGVPRVEDVLTETGLSRHLYFRIKGLVDGDDVRLKAADERRERLWSVEQTEERLVEQPPVSGLDVLDIGRPIQGLLSVLKSVYVRYFEAVYGDVEAWRHTGLTEAEWNEMKASEPPSDALTKQFVSARAKAKPTATKGASGAEQPRAGAQRKGDQL